MAHCKKKTYKTNTLTSKGGEGGRGPETKKTINFCGKFSFTLSFFFP